MPSEKFLDLILNAQSIKRKIGPYLKKKLLLCERPCEKGGKISSRTGEIFANQISDEELVSGMYKELSKLHSKRQRLFTKEDIQIVNKHMSRT